MIKYSNRMWFHCWRRSWRYGYSRRNCSRHPGIKSWTRLFAFAQRMGKVWIQTFSLQLMGQQQASLCFLNLLWSSVWEEEKTELKPVADLERDGLRLAILAVEAIYDLASLRVNRITGPVMKNKYFLGLEWSRNCVPYREERLHRKKGVS